MRMAMMMHLIPLMIWLGPSSLLGRIQNSVSCSIKDTSWRYSLSCSVGCQPGVCFVHCLVFLVIDSRNDTIQANVWYHSRSNMCSKMLEWS